MRIIFLLVVFPFISFSQKTQVNTISASHINKIVIDSDEIFKITVTTSDTEKITINTVINGETFDSTLLNTQEKEDALIISTGKTPDFIPFNDKLSAHKVLSIELKIIIPENLHFIVQSTLAEVKVKGSFGKIEINLGRGGFMGDIMRFCESTIKTISGNVTLNLRNGSINAETRNGNKNILFSNTLGPKCTIQSIYGDIMVHQLN